MARLHDIGINEDRLESAMTALVIFFCGIIAGIMIAWTMI
jgi:hypothetical protein